MTHSFDVDIFPSGPLTSIPSSKPSTIAVSKKRPTSSTGILGLAKKKSSQGGAFE